MPHRLSLSALSQALQTKQISSVELCTHYLQRMQAAQSLNAFISIDEEQALLAAHKADIRLQQRLGTPLTGIPLAHKDNLCTRSARTTCGSKMLADFKLGSTKASKTVKESGFKKSLKSLRPFTSKIIFIS